MLHEVVAKLPVKLLVAKLCKSRCYSVRHTVPGMRSSQLNGCPCLMPTLRNVPRAISLVHNNHVVQNDACLHNGMHACRGPSPSGSRNDVPPRLQDAKSAFNVLPDGLLHLCKKS